MSGPLPKFDFSLSLDLMRRIKSEATLFDGASTARALARDNALDPLNWHGPYAEDARARAVAEDTQGSVAFTALEDLAEDWAVAWQTAADDTNEVLYQRAIKRHADAFNTRKAERKAEFDAWREENPDEDFSFGPAPVVEGTVQPPKPAQRPVPPLYDTPGNNFAVYYPSGPSMLISYWIAPPND